MFKYAMFKYANLYTVLISSLLLTSGNLNAETDFLKVCASKSADSDTMSIPGHDGWYFLRKELSHLGKGEFWGDKALQTNATSKESSRDPMKAILAYQAALDKAGIKLLLVPVPAKAAIYPDKLDTRFKVNDDDFRKDTFHKAFYATLRNSGVDVLDLTETLLRARKQNIYCKTDSHFSPAGIRIIADLIAAKIKQSPWYADASKKQFTLTKKEVLVKGDLIRDKPDVSGEKLTLDIISQPTTSKQSPVVLLADSHGLIFHAGDDMLAEHAGLVDQLAYQSKLPIDLYATRGSGATPTRINFYRAAKKDANYIKGKKLLIWLMTVREFTESSWHPKVPVGKK